MSRKLNRRKFLQTSAVSATAAGSALSITMRCASSVMIFANSLYFVSKPAGNRSTPAAAALSCEAWKIARKGFCARISGVSEPGRGATFKVYLPSLGTDAETSDSGAPPTEMPRGSETVLVAEDEAGLRSIVRELLQSLGYTVLVAEHGADALRVALGVVPQPVAGDVALAADLHRHPRRASCACRQSIRA